MYKSMVPEEKRVIDYTKKTIELRRQLPGNHHKVRNE
jgi:hypothetical protein